MDDDTKNTLLGLIEGARSDAESEPGDFSAVTTLLDDLESAVHGGRVPADLIGATEDVSRRFPVLAFPTTKGAGHPGEPGSRDSNLVQLRNKLKELGGN